MLKEPDGEASGDKAGRIVGGVILMLFGALAAFDAYIAGPVQLDNGVAAIAYPLAGVAIWRRISWGALVPPVWSLSMLVVRMWPTINVFALLGWATTAALWFLLFFRMRKIYSLEPAQGLAKNA